MENGHNSCELWVSSYLSSSSHLSLMTKHQRTSEKTSPPADIQQMFTTLQAQLETVYDPEFPVIDIRTLWLFYDITINEDDNLIFLLMTFTTPACPMWDLIKEMTKNAVYEVYPDREVELEITFDPLRSPKMIRDEDLQRMFE